MSRGLGDVYKRQDNQLALIKKTENPKDVASMLNSDFIKSVRIL
jgi:hypothetical protein